MAKTCPVNFQQVDENQIRIQAVFVALSAVIFIATGWIALAFLLAYDFAVRLFITPKLSPFAQLANLILNILNITEKCVDSAPKIFASRIGLGFSVAIAATAFFGFYEAAMILSIILAVCAGLEAVFNYCVGCKFYSILHHFNLV